MEILNFKSIKVQLELEFFRLHYRHSSKFQFHKGTIRTFCSCLPSSEPLYFNSIKVQLERTILQSTVIIMTVFQFHKGTIRTRFLLLRI